LKEDIAMRLEDVVGVERIDVLGEEAMKVGRTQDVYEKSN
jgi:hypothetical protein